MNEEKNVRRVLVAFSVSFDRDDDDKTFEHIRQTNFFRTDFSGCEFSC